MTVAKFHVSLVDQCNFSFKVLVTFKKSFTFLLLKFSYLFRLFLSYFSTSQVKQRKCTQEKSIYMRMIMFISSNKKVLVKYNAAVYGAENQLIH